MEFDSLEAHREWLELQAALPEGFSVGNAELSFNPVEVPSMEAHMKLTLITLTDGPTPHFGALFTKNAFPGAPILVGRRRLHEESIGAIIVNNKISNVCGGGDGEADSEALCGRVAEMLGLESGRQVIPSSTGVIGWRLPIEPMLEALPAAKQSLQSESIVPAAVGICTTDLYPKVRCAELTLPGGTGRIVGISKGAGMVEPNMATMLVYVLTDIAIPREELREMLARSVDDTFNCISVDSDTSTSDTIVVASSAKVELPSESGARAQAVSAFGAALQQVCAELAVDVVRNGEGVHHVVQVQVKGAPSRDVAHGVGKSIINSPLLKAAVAGNDPNVGRLVCAIGKFGGTSAGQDMDLSNCSIYIGGRKVFEGGKFMLDADAETFLHEHFAHAEMYASTPKVTQGAGQAPSVTFQPPRSYPSHERNVEFRVELGQGDVDMCFYGSDLTHEYVEENAYYRS